MSLPTEFKAPLYDADVLVIGAGPAGLAAAIRARWVKGYRALSSSVLLFDPVRPGGLLPWGGCVLTGPAWASSGEQALRPLLKDIEQLEIPIISAAVVRLERWEYGFRLFTEDGRQWRGLSVVLACGLRRLGPEVAEYPRGVHVTFKGMHFLPTLAHALAKEANGRGLLIVGHEQTHRLLPLLLPVAERAGGIQFLLESPQLPLPSAWQGPAPVYCGQVESFERTDSQALSGVWARLDDGRRRWLQAGAVLLDYHAFELRPGPLPLLEGLALKTSSTGFVKADGFLATSEPGLFAAGDITGRYASTLTALGDGVGAGFSAHRHAYQLKFGHEPSLFAYRPVEHALSAMPEDLPRLDDACYVVPILGKHAFQADPEVAELLWEAPPLGALRAQVERTRLEPLLTRWIDSKALAIHRRPHASTP